MHLVGAFATAVSNAAAGLAASSSHASASTEEGDVRKALLGLRGAGTAVPSAAAAVGEQVHDTGLRAAFLTSVL